MEGREGGRERERDEYFSNAPERLRSGGKNWFVSKTMSSGVIKSIMLGERRQAISCLCIQSNSSMAEVVVVDFLCFIAEYLAFHRSKLQQTSVDQFCGTE